MPRQSTRTKKPATKTVEPEKVEKVVEEKPQKEQKKRGRKPKQVVEETPVEDKMEVEEEQKEEDATIQTKADEQQPEQQEEAGSDSEDGSDDEEENDLDLNALDESDSDSEFERDLNEKQSAAGIQANKYQKAAEEESSDEEDEDEIDIDDLDAEGEEGEEIKAISQARQTINNKQGLLTALKRFALDTTDKAPFAFHQSVVSEKVTEESIPAIDDDLARELAFMNQALEAARVGRALLRKEGVPFTRPTDYFAETLRSDEIMEKVKAKLIEEATAKKASAEARKQRDLKKFGKQVQVAKQQERAKQKRDTLEKINLLKKKRKDGGGPTGANEAEDLFDVAVDNELKGKPGSKDNSKKRGRDGKESGGPNAKRQRKNDKFGFGGKKKYAKSNDALSSGDVSGFSARKMKSGGGPGGGSKPKKFKPAPRPGKARRAASAGRR
ncbi:eukaryotic rRNA processing protein EBP2-domain-containing protein [Pseudoneurospora amorphoporcata]|uniref:Eukaryotic rRNA processing protein EBP2-domain-containing protein n=1 Tax=Pseudoneurospora amorphoporcata TaxID=241081 RepID=A0AAN6NMB5_9PEZI|nr:eukaryotic rRNA processing protein EBP2-domain-containing protein [Pseudoneurospora amorphoporcata]